MKKNRIEENQVKTVGVFLARMQPVHKAHLFMVTKACEECDEGDYLCTFVVLFDKEEKITSVYCDEYSEDYEYGYDATSAIDMELLKAINQQVKELGWLDD